jgi:hypothetical protein
MIRADAAQYTENRLHEERRLHQTAIDKMGQIVEMTNIVALELKAGAMPLT